MVQIEAIFEDDTPRTVSNNNSNISSENNSSDIEIEEYNEADKASYDTGITYDQLARTPDDYENKK